MLKRHRDRWEDEHPDKNEDDWRDYAKDVMRMTERWMDEGYGACHFRKPNLATVMADALRFYEDSKCSVLCFIVMPNHVHAVMSPLAGNELEEVLQRMKGWVARQINRELGQKSTIWAQESYDRIIRDEEHLFRAVQYVGRNGRAAGLGDGEYLRWICEEWIDAGWGFRDD